MCVSSHCTCFILITPSACSFIYFLFLAHNLNCITAEYINRRTTTPSSSSLQLTTAIHLLRSTSTSPCITLLLCFPQCLQQYSVYHYPERLYHIPWHLRPFATTRSPVITSCFPPVFHHMIQSSSPFNSILLASPATRPTLHSFIIIPFSCSFPHYISSLYAHLHS
jgi:hypothetical protein